MRVREELEGAARRHQERAGPASSEHGSGIPQAGGIDLYGDLAGILTLAGKKATPLDQNDLSVQQVKVVAGVRFVQARTTQVLRKDV
jgi:hypothetical protein